MNDDPRPPLPEISSPFPHRINSHVEQMREHLAAWTSRIGLVRHEAARQRFERADFGWFAAMVYPTASPSHAHLMADWFAWLFLVDDQLDDGHTGHDPKHVGEAVDQMRAVLDSPDFGASLTSSRNLPVAVSALADLWTRTAPDTTGDWRRRFTRHLDHCLAAATTWEAANRAGGIVPDEDTYVPQRRHTGAIYVCMDFIDIVARLHVPQALYDSAAFTGALNAACDVVCWTNDVYSHDKERSLGEVHNLVHIVAHHHGLDRQQAMRRVGNAIAAKTRCFEARERELLLAYPQHTETLRLYLDGMRTWMRGNLDWSQATKRYRPADRDHYDRPERYLETGIMGADR